MVEDVAIRHVMPSLVSLNNQTGCHERGTSEVEEIVRCTHLVHGEYLLEDVAEEFLELICRLHIITVACRNHRSRQCLAVHLLILVERNAVYLHGGSRHHIGRLALSNEIIELLDVDLFIAHHISSNVLTTILILEGLHGGILDAWILTDDSLHFLQFDAETANLHLSIATTDELDITIRKVTHNIARSINRAFTEWVRDINLFRFLRTVQIATAHLWTRSPEFSCRTYRKTMPVGIDDVDLGVVGRNTNRDIAKRLLHVVGGDANRTFRWAVDVDQSVVFRWCQRSELLTACEQPTE